MDKEFWRRIGLLLAVIGIVGWIVDNAILCIPVFAIGSILYIMPEEYYGKRKEGK